jgi:hypothetical protein
MSVNTGPVINLIILVLDVFDCSSYHSNTRCPGILEHTIPTILTTLTNATMRIKIEVRIICIKVSGTVTEERKLNGKFTDSKYEKVLGFWQFVHIRVGNRYDGGSTR